MLHVRSISLVIQYSFSTLFAHLIFGVFCFCRLFYIIAISGYLYAKEGTLDNILLNFEINFDLITLGRLGFGLMLIFVLPLNMLPCRDSFLSLPILFRNLYESDKPILHSQADDKGRQPHYRLPISSEYMIPLSTLAILIFCFILSVLVPGVGILWAFCGSSMSLLFGFFVPCACYLKLCEDHTNLNVRSNAAILIGIFSLGASIVCTIQIVSDARNMENK